jgi:hypothetical protein
MRAGVLARSGRNGSKSVSRFLRRMLVEQLRLEMTRLDRNLTSHFSAPQGGASRSGSAPFFPLPFLAVSGRFTRMARVFFMSTGAFGTRQHGNSCAWKA